MKEVVILTKVEKQQSNLLWNYFSILPKSEIEKLGLKDRRTLVSINGSEFKSAAIFPSKTGAYFINLHQALRKKLGLILGQEIEVKVRPDESKYGAPLPEEFDELLQQDEEGATHFENLTPGKKRSLLYLVSKLKSADKRIEKSVVILEYLKRNQGKLDFRQLNQDFKNAHNLF